MSDPTASMFSVRSGERNRSRASEGNMLQALRITNFAVIEEVEVGFGAGLTVLTGETGAGKSILIDALGLLLGGRADPDMVRAGCEEAAVEGLFSGTPILRGRLVELGLPDGEE